MSETITIHIKSSAGKKFEVAIATSATVEELKEKISSLEEELPATSQRLIYSGRVLKDTETLEFYKIKDGHTIHLVKSANKAAPTSVSGASSSEVATQPTSASNAVPINLAAGSGAFNPLADLTGARYAGYTQLPSASMFGPDGGMSLPNPEDMERMLENPMVQQSMNEMLSNPQMVDFLINQSPEMRAMGPQARELLQSEGFRNMLTNPQMLRQMRDMQRIMGGGQQQQQQAFPAPGSSETTESIDDTATNTSATQQPANPFAAMFPGGIPQNPFTLFGNQQGGTNGSTGANPWGAPDPEMMQAIMASLGGGSSSASQQDTRPPEERYADQLRQLNEMGFNDFERNVLALRRSGGNVQGAVENLLRDGF